jgi:hypothetical protein
MPAVCYLAMILRQYRRILLAYKNRLDIQGESAHLRRMLQEAYRRAPKCFADRRELPRSKEFFEYDDT